MRRWYYTLLVLLAVALAGLVGARWFGARPVPVQVGEIPGLRWHIVDPEGVVKPLLPIPQAALAAIRAIHVGGADGDPLIIEAQTRLPGWLLRFLPVAGFYHQRSAWDLCLVREGLSRPLAPVSDPVRRAPGAASLWLPGDPPVTVTLHGGNPFEFSSFCPGEAEEAVLPGPSAGATLFLAAGRSPHLARFLPGVIPERVEAGPDWADAVLVSGDRKREARWGAAPGPPGEGKRLTLRLRYQSGAGGVHALLGRFFPKGPVPAWVREVEAECAGVEGGERCEGRLTLTF